MTIYFRASHVLTTEDGGTGYCPDNVLTGIDRISYPQTCAVAMPVIRFHSGERFYTARITDMERIAA